MTRSLQKVLKSSSKARRVKWLRRKIKMKKKRQPRKNKMMSFLKKKMPIQRQRRRRQNKKMRGINL